MGQPNTDPSFPGLSPRVLGTLSEVSGLSLESPSLPVPPAVLDGVRRLSAQFNRGEGLGNRPYLNEAAFRTAYLSYFVPVNLVKVQILLNEAKPAIGALHGRSLRILDVGGGPGTGALAILDWLQRLAGDGPTALEYTVIDHSREALAVHERVWRGYRAHGPAQEPQRLQTVECDLEKGLPSIIQAARGRPTHDLIIVQNLLSELYRNEADRIEKRVLLLERLLGGLAVDGTIIIIEPALRGASRDLHGLRDRLLQQGSATVYSPCLHSHPCPALVKPDDWCHEERGWVRPKWIEQVDRAVGFIKDALKFSYVILRRDGKTLVPRSPDLHRVVSELRVMKGEKRVWWCDETGRPEVGRLDREQSATNAVFDAWHRGAIVRVSEIVRKDRKGRPGTVGRIPSSATVEIVRPA